MPRAIPTIMWLGCFCAFAALAFGARALAEPEIYYPPDVVEQFNAITERADALGFGIGDSRDPDICRHYQGIARSHGPGRPYFFITKSENNPPNTPCPALATDGAGSLLVIRMGSRDTTGERLRSNRIQPNKETKDTPPDSRDTTVSFILFDGEGDWPDYGHPGGLQLVGDVLAVPLETPNEQGLPDNLIVFVDISNPEEPAYLSKFEPTGSDDFSAGLVALAPRPNGRYLMLVSGQKNKELKIYESLPTDGEEGTTDLHDPDLDWTLLDTWTESADESEVGNDWPTFQTHQSLNFVREDGPNGPLFLIGARGLPFVGEDWFDVYRVYWAGEEFKLRWESSRHVKSFPSSDAALVFHDNIANFAAASGTYVSPSGEIILYATEHDNDGPGVEGRGSIKAGEWRHVDMVRRGSPTLDPTLQFGGPHIVEEGATMLLSAVGGQPATKAWVELWADPHFSDRYLVIDYLDRFDDDFNDFKDLDGGLYPPGFSDQASSLRYFAPEGCTIRVNDDDFGDDDFPGSQTRTLPGVGVMVPLNNLKSVAPDDSGGDIDDKLTSAQFFSDCDAYYGASITIDWDLDGIGDFEESGNLVTYSAELRDGPAELQVLARATHPIDGRTTLGLTEVRVTNVAPTIEEIIVSDSLGRDLAGEMRPVLVNLPVSFLATFDDQFAFDTHTALIDWDDGATTSEVEAEEFQSAVGVATVGHIAHPHAYPSPGTFSIEVSVVDDDGGASARSVEVVVLGAEEAIGDVADTIAQMLDGESSSERASALLAALNTLVGNNGGLANNGALDHMEDERLNPAMLRLASAIDALAEHEALGGASTEDLRATLALAAHSLATGRLQGAKEANPHPWQKNVLREIERAEIAIAEGALLLQSHEYVDAVREFRTAAQVTKPLY